MYDVVLKDRRKVRSYSSQSIAEEIKQEMMKQAGDAGQGYSDSARLTGAIAADFCARVYSIHDNLNMQSAASLTDMDRVNQILNNASCAEIKFDVGLTRYDLMQSNVMYNGQNVQIADFDTLYSRVFNPQSQFFNSEMACLAADIRRPSLEEMVEIELACRTAVKSFEHEMEDILKGIPSDNIFIRTDDTLSFRNKNGITETFRLGENNSLQHTMNVSLSELTFNNRTYASIADQHINGGKKYMQSLEENIGKLNDYFVRNGFNGFNNLSELEIMDIIQRVEKGERGARLDIFHNNPELLEMLKLSRPIVREKERQSGRDKAVGKSSRTRNQLVMRSMRESSTFQGYKYTKQVAATSRVVYKSSLLLARGLNKASAHGLAFVARKRGHEDFAAKVLQKSNSIGANLKQAQNFAPIKKAKTAVKKEVRNASMRANHAFSSRVATTLSKRPAGAKLVKRLTTFRGRVNAVTNAVKEAIKKVAVKIMGAMKALIPYVIVFVVIVILLYTIIMAIVVDDDDGQDDSALGYTEGIEKAYPNGPYRSDGHYYYETYRTKASVATDTLITNAKDNATSLLKDDYPIDNRYYTDTQTLNDRVFAKPNYSHTFYIGKYDDAHICSREVWYQSTYNYVVMTAHFEELGVKYTYYVYGKAGYKMDDTPVNYMMELFNKTHTNSKTLEISDVYFCDNKATCTNWQTYYDFSEMVKSEVEGEIDGSNYICDVLSMTECETCSGLGEITSYYFECPNCKDIAYSDTMRTSKYRCPICKSICFRVPNIVVCDDCDGVGYTETEQHCIISPIPIEEEDHNKYCCTRNGCNNYYTVKTENLPTSKEGCCGHVDVKLGLLASEYAKYQYLTAAESLKDYGVTETTGVDEMDYTEEHFLSMYEAAFDEYIVENDDIFLKGTQFSEDVIDSYIGTAIAEYKQKNSDYDMPKEVFNALELGLSLVGKVSYSRLYHDNYSGLADGTNMQTDDSGFISYLYMASGAPNVERIMTAQDFYNMSCNKQRWLLRIHTNGIRYDTNGADSANINGTLDYTKICEELSPGDLILKNSETSDTNHIVMYIGGNKVLECNKDMGTTTIKHISNYLDYIYVIKFQRT